MSEKIIVDIGTSRADEIAGCQHVFGRKFDQNFDWITEGTNQGTHHAHTIRISGVPSYVVIWHLSDQHFFCVNAVAAIRNGTPDFSALITALKEMAKRVQATAIEGITVRRGMVECLKEHGFIPSGVCMTLQL